MSVVGTVAAAATFYFTGGNVQATMAAYSIGSGVESLVNPQQVEGPRLDDLRVQMSSYGAPIPVEWGVNRHAGTIIWPKILDLKESSSTDSAKGGPETTSYSYSCSVAVLLCEGPIAGVRRIWANKRLVYDVTAGAESPTKDPALHGLRFYLGTETQEVDPLIEATDGASPAYLGYAYCVFEDFDLADYANRPPQFEFEVITNGSGEVAPIKHLLPTTGWTAGDGFAVMDTDTGYIWATAGGPTADPYVIVADPVTEEVVATIPLPGTGHPSTLVFVDARNEIWVGNGDAGAGWILSAIDLSVVGSFTPTITLPGNQVVTGVPQGTLVYVAATDEIWSFYQSSYGADNYVSVTNAITRAPAGSFQYTGNNSNFGYTFNVVYVPDHAWVVAFRNDFVYVIDALSRQLLSTNPSPFDGSASLLRTYYDAANQRLYLFGLGDTLSYYQIDGMLLTLVETAKSAASGVYNPQDGQLYLSIASGGQSRLEAVDQDTFVPSATLGNVNTAYLGKLLLSPNADKLIGIDGSRIDIIPITPRLAPAQVPLSTIVVDICKRAGMADGDIDATGLTDLVDGYTVPRQMTARAAIEPLQQAYYFDAVESDDKLKFVKRGINAPVLIPMESRSAREFGADLPDSLNIIRAQDMELPVQCDVEYPDVDADHLIGNQYDRRLTKDTKQRINLQLPIVMGAEKAKQVAIVNLYAAWLNESYKFTTSRAFAHLEPTDLVTLPTNDASYTARLLTKREQPNGIIEWEAKKEGVSVYTQSGAGASPTNYVSQSIFTPGTTAMELMDLPLVRDQDVGKGFPVALAGTSANWPGAQLFKSTDAGSTYGTLYSQADAAVIGRATTVLGNFTGGDIFDDGNTVTVKIQPGGQLVSYSDAQLLAGTSAFALGVNGRWEIVQYKTATLIAPLTYALTGLLRGRRGTEWATGTHQVGDHFVMLNTGGVQFYDPGVADVGVERLYKAPAFRAALSSAAAVPFTDTLVRLRPYSVANLKVEDAGNGFAVSWAHRSILGGGWRDGGDVPLDATFAAFDVSIYKTDGSLVKTYSVTDEAFFYSDEQILIDFGAAPGDFKVRVAQRNTDYGQGIGVTIATNNPALDYDVPPIYTGGGGAAPGDLPPEPTPAPDAPAADAWKFEGRLAEDIFEQYHSYNNNLTHATPTHVFLFGGMTHVFVPNGVSYPEVNPNVYIFNRATKTFTVVDNGQVSGYGFEMNAGAVGSKHYFVDGRPSASGPRTVVCNDFSNPAAPSRSAYQSANAIVATFLPRGTVNFGCMVNGKIWFPASCSVFDPTANTWAAMPAPPVDCRYRPLLCGLGAKLYFLGGTTSVTDPFTDINPGPVQQAPNDATTYKKEVWAFDTVAGTWARKADLPYAIACNMVRWATANDPNYNATFNVEGVNGKLYVFDSNGQILIYDEAADSWTSKPNQIGYRMFVSTSVQGSSIWMSTHMGIPKSYGPQKANQDFQDNFNTFELAQRLIFRYTPSLDV